MDRPVRTLMLAFIATLCLVSTAVGQSIADGLIDPSLVSEVVQSVESMNHDSQLIESSDSMFQSRLDSLQRQIDDLKASNPASVDCCPAEKPKPKFPTATLTGFFQLDSARFHQSESNLATLGDIQDGTGFRRARLAATGNITPRSTFMMEFDMAQGQARFVDVWGQVNDTPFGNLRVGRFRQPFGMTELTPVRDLPFLERPTIFALSPFRQTGIMLFDTAMSQQMTWAVSGFRTISDNFGNVYGDDGGYGTAERFTALLVDKGDCGLFHVGLDHSFLDPARGQILIASQDEVFVGQNPTLGPGGLTSLPIVNVPPFVNSGVFDVSHVNLYNIEAAVSVGRSLVQTEYRWSNIELPTGDNVTVHGGYITTRYMLTGETIPYKRANGVFGGVTPRCPLDVCKGQWGAWELAGRISTLDLNPLFGAAGVTGSTRRLNSTSLALNWYCWAGTKAQVEWVHGRLNDPVSGDSTANTFAGRIQFAF